MNNVLFATLISILCITACASSTPQSSSTENSNATASSPASSAGDKVTCTQGNDSRALEIRSTKTNGCELFYTKFGTEKAVALSAGTKYCKEVREKIKLNLTQSGFKCE